MHKRDFIKTLIAGVTGLFVTRPTPAKEELTLESLNEVFAKIEEHDLKVAKDFIHPDVYDEVFEDLKEINTEVKREVLMNGTFGHMFTADIHMTNYSEFKRDKCEKCGFKDAVVTFTDGSTMCKDCGRATCVKPSSLPYSTQEMIANNASSVEPQHFRKYFQDIKYKRRKPLNVNEFPKSFMEQYETDVECVARILKGRKDHEKA